MRVNINEFKIGDTISQYFILKTHTIKTTRANKKYINATFIDKTGSISGNMWNIPSNQLELTDGGFVSATFVVSSYNDVLQAEISAIVPVDSNSISYEEKAEMVPSIEYNPEELFNALMQKIQGLTRKEYRDFGVYMLTNLKDQFISCPGAMSVHHAEIGGLLLHSWEVVRFVEATYYVTPWFDKEMCILAATLHDIGKITEFTLGETGLVSDYSAEGQLIGHIQIGMEAMDEAKNFGFNDEQVMLLKHIILAHHGKPEYGSPVVPKTMEAEVVHMADDLSAKMHIFRDAVKDVQPGEFSEKQFALDGAKVYRPKYKEEA